MTNSDDPAPDRLLRLPLRLFDDRFFYLPVRPQVPTGEDRPRISIPIPRSDLEDPGISRLISEEYSGGGFECTERDALLEGIAPGDLFVDIGAHFGLYSLEVAARFERVRCLAIEPHPKNFASLESAVRHNGLSDRIQVVQKAIGRRDGEGYLRLNTSMGHHLTLDGRAESAGALPVSVVTLDTLLAGNSLFDAGAGCVLKVDVEGRELAVFEGAENLLRSGRVRSILWEYRIGSLENPDSAAISELLASYGLRSRRVSEHSMLSELPA